MEKKVIELSQGELDVIATYMDNGKAVETYVKSDIIALNNLYSEKVGE